MEVHHPLFYQLAHVMVQRPDMFRTLPLDGVPYQRLRTFGIREDLQAPARLIQPQNVDVVFTWRDASLHVAYSASVLECTTLLIR